MSDILVMAAFQYNFADVWRIYVCVKGKRLHS